MKIKTISGEEFATQRSSDWCLKMDSEGDWTLYWGWDYNRREWTTDETGEDVDWLHSSPLEDIESVCAASNIDHDDITGMVRVNQIIEVVRGEGA